MKRTLGLLAVLALGCGQSSPSVQESRTVELRVLGTNTGRLLAALVEVKEVVVTAAGRPLKVSPGQSKIDLTNVSHAWLVGSFEMPKDVDQVHVAITLDDFGGWEATYGAGYFDVRNSTIEFDAPVAWLAERNHATVHLDLQRSFVTDARGKQFLMPNLMVQY